MFNGIEETWKTLEEISKITECSEYLILEYIDKEGGFVKNSKNQYTTRNLYERRTPLMKKIINTMINKII